MVGSISWENTSENIEWLSANQSNAWTTFSSLSIGSNDPRVLKGIAIDSSNGTLPELQFSTLKKGDYKIVVSVALWGFSGASEFRIYDPSNSKSSSQVRLLSGNGSNVGVPSATFSMDYDTDQTNITLRLESKGSGDKERRFFSNAQAPGKIVVYYYPTQE